MKNGTGQFDLQSKRRACRRLLLDLVALPLLILLAVLMFLLLAPGSSRAEVSAGRVGVIDSGQKASVVNVLRPGKKGFAQVKAGDPVFPGDTIKTGEDVRVRLDMADSSVINIGPESTFRIKAFSLKQEESKRNSVFKVFKGTVRFIVAKVLNGKNWSESNVAVETPVAVAGVRGTDFITVVRTDKPVPEVEIAVFDGVVSARSTNLMLRGSVTISGGQITNVPRGAVPSPPTVLSPERRATLTNSTTPGPRSPGQPQAKPQPKAKGGYSASDMERDLAAGVPLAQVLDRAVESGMSVNQAVDAAIDAGVPAYSVVYTAITEGYSATAVVDAALSAGASLNEVVAAGVVAGAEPKAIMGGAQLAGVSPEETATALSTAPSAVSPQTGYQQPAPQPSPDTVIPAPAPAVSSGGGTTPSTQPASPYKP